jgi:Organic solute transporter Ostalpha
LLTLRFIDARLYLDPIRECYEAFVIYNFYMFLIAYLEVSAELDGIDTEVLSLVPVQCLLPHLNHLIKAARVHMFGLAAVRTSMAM